MNTTKISSGDILCAHWLMNHLVIRLSANDGSTIRVIEYRSVVGGKMYFVEKGTCICAYACQACSQYLENS